VFDFGGSNQSLGMVTLRPGQVVELVTAGGGGYGDPALRDPAAAAQDAREGRFPARAAE
jgi:N-methylhydantoinase B